MPRKPKTDKTPRQDRLWNRLIGDYRLWAEANLDKSEEAVALLEGLRASAHWTGPMVERLQAVIWATQGRVVTDDMP